MDQSRGDNRTGKPPFIVGWEEWVALPGLGLPAIKAKIDTGARTSALHAFLIEPFGPPSAPMVRFGVHPMPGRTDIAIYCSAPISGSRDVTSSNGEKETRVFIQSELRIGDRSWPIEIGLTNRESMSYRMLIGRQAITDDMMIDPAGSFCQPRLSYRAYRHLQSTAPRPEPVRRALRLAVLTATPHSPSNRHLAAAAENRGHVLEVLDLARLAMTFDGHHPGLDRDGEPLPHYDAVIPRIGLSDGRLGAAIVRQLELMGSFAANPGDALDLRANPLALVQRLNRDRVSHAVGGGAPGPTASHATYRMLLVGGKVVGALHRTAQDDTDVSGKRLKQERTLAERTVKALALGLATVDIDISTGAPRVAAVSARPVLTQFKAPTRAAITAAIITLIESRVLSPVEHP